MLTRQTSAHAFIFGLVATIGLYTGLELQQAHEEAQAARAAAIVKLEPVLIQGKRASGEQVAQLPTVVVSGHRHIA